MLNCKQIKSVLKNKVRLTESFLVFFLITGSISYGKVATEITKDEIIEKAYTIIGNIDNPNVIINCLEDEDAKEKYNAMVSEAGISLTNNGTILAKVALKGEKSVVEALGNGIYISKILTYERINDIVDIRNNGVISGDMNIERATSNNQAFANGSGNGVYVSGAPLWTILDKNGKMSRIIDVDNSGVISGYINVSGEANLDFASFSSVEVSGNGIVISNNYTPTKYSDDLISIDNYGLVKGLESAIYRGNPGILINNYGILAGQQIIGSSGVPTKVHVNNYNNYGTEVIINENGEVLSVNIGAGGTIDDYTILNGSKEDGKNRYTNASQLEKTSNLIINGVGTNDIGALTVNGGSKFTGTDVTFNGGGFGKFNEDTKEIEYEAVIKGDARDNTLEILGNSFINGKVDLGAGNDYLLVSNGI